MIIDVHTHAFPDALAARAIASLEAQSPWKAVSGGTVDELVASMDAAGVDKAVLCPIATRPSQTEGIFQWSQQVRSDRLMCFPSVHPDTPDSSGWVERFARAGFTGIKLHPMYQAFAADEARLEPIYDAAATAGLAVTIHCGLDIAFPPDDDRAKPARLVRVIQRRPDLKLICTHLGGWRMWDQVRTSGLLDQPVWMETSFATEEQPAEHVAELIRRVGADRVMFGSDWPWARQVDELARVRALELEPGQIDGILGDNARRLLGI